MSPLRIIGPDGNPTMSVSGFAGRPAPAGYLDNVGAFHRECRHQPGECAPLYSQYDIDRLVERLRAAGVEIPTTGGSPYAPYRSPT